MVASQMENTILDSTTVDIVTNTSASGKRYTFQVVGSVTKFKGFRTLYTEGTDDEDLTSQNDNALPFFRGLLLLIQEV